MTKSTVIDQHCTSRCSNLVKGGKLRIEIQYNPRSYTSIQGNLKKKPTEICRDRMENYFMKLCIRNVCKLVIQLTTCMQYTPFFQ